MDALLRFISCKFLSLESLFWFITVLHELPDQMAAWKVVLIYNSPLKPDAIFSGITKAMNPTHSRENCAKLKLFTGTWIKIYSIVNDHGSGKGEQVPFIVKKTCVCIIKYCNPFLPLIKMEYQIWQQNILLPWCELKLTIIRS